ncbi:hypothetical protein L218DRAFT_947297 [Marasmius fiardii PR-910]|nr:hypothetical protein L218DRAFT_947297 [Marasmius fiardii PR-910]
MAAQPRRDFSSLGHILIQLQKAQKRLLNDLEFNKNTERAVSRFMLDDTAKGTTRGRRKFHALRSLKMEEAKLDEGPTAGLIYDLEETVRVRYVNTSSEETLRTVEATLAAGEFIDGTNEALTDAYRWRADYMYGPDQGIAP